MPEKIPYKQVGDRIKFLRNNNEISQPQCANLLNISLRTYQRYEQGERLPGPKLLDKMSDILNASPAWIVFGQTTSEGPFNEDDICEVFDKIELLFSRGSFTLINFFIKILNLTVTATKGGMNRPDREGLIDVLTKVSDVATNEIRNNLKKETD
jgi:transcriptional regulator with XRE-family HTH domain